MADTNVTIGTGVRGRIGTDNNERAGTLVHGTVHSLNTANTVPHSSPDPHTPNMIPHTPPQAQRQRNVNGKPAQRIRNPSIGK